MIVRDEPEIQPRRSEPPLRAQPAVGFAVVAVRRMADPPGSVHPPSSQACTPFGSGRSRLCSTDGDFAGFEGLDRIDPLKRTSQNPVQGSGPFRNLLNLNEPQRP